VLAPLLWASAAGAHATLESTSPAAGAVLADSPSRITLTFDGHVDVVPRAIRLVDSDGHGVALGPVGRDGPSRLTASVPELGSGSYVVAWRAVSADSHPISGAFTFSVGAPTPRRPGLVGRLLRSERPSQGSEISIGAARWLSYSGLALWVGTVGVLALCDPSAWRRRRARRLLYAACAAGAAGTAWMIAAQARIQVGHWWSPGDWRAVIDTSAGRWWAARLAGFVLAAAVVPVLHRRRSHASDVDDPPAGTAGHAGADLVGASVAVALVVIVAGGGHGITGRWVPLGFGATVVHLATMGLWAGGLAALLALGSARRYPPSMGRFSSVALWCVVALAVTGVFNAWREAGSLSQLTGSSYGSWLYLKLALVALVLVVAARSRRLARPGAGGNPPGPGRIATLVGTEVVVMALILGATAGLVSSPPPREAALRPETRSAVQGDRYVQMTLDPPVAGGATVHVYVQGPGGTVSRPEAITVLAAVPARGITGLDLTDRLRNAGPGHLVGPVALPLPGEWTFTVTARFGEFEAATFELEFTVR